jgi:hypothetical protein
MLFAAVHESAFGTKRTWAGALQMSAYDPKRTCPLRREYLSDSAFRAPILAQFFFFEAQMRALAGKEQ